jgi:hypothetical protein
LAKRVGHVQSNLTFYGRNRKRLHTQMQRWAFKIRVIPASVGFKGRKMKVNNREIPGRNIGAVTDSPD